jgi:hypothetical protein
MMAVVVLAAADCLALRWFFVRGSRSVLLVCGLLPQLNLLGIGLLLGLRGLVDRRRCPGFLVGSQALGWMAAAAYTIACVSPAAWDLATPYLEFALGPSEALLNRMGLVYDDDSILWRMLSYVESTAALSAPLLACGLAGGWCAHRFEISLVRGALFTSG